MPRFRSKAPALVASSARISNLDSMTCKLGQLMQVGLLARADHWAGWTAAENGANTRHIVPKASDQRHGELPKWQDKQHITGGAFQSRSFHISELRRVSKA